MGHGAVARDGFGQTRLPQPVLRSGELGLRAAVLVAQRDFEVEDLLAVADEAEGPRFDDACVVLIVMVRSASQATCPSW